MPPDSPGSWAARFRRCTSATTWCDEPAEQVGRRQQVWQEVNLQLRLAGAVERWIGWGRFHNRIALASSGSLEHRQHCLAPDIRAACGRPSASRSEKKPFTDGISPGTNSTTT